MSNALYERFGREISKGTVLFREGEPGEQMFIIQSGSVKITKNVREVEKHLVTLGAGEFFGEMSILNNKPRSATATADSDLKVLQIDPKTFEAMVKGNSEIAVRLIKKLAQRLQDADEQIENLLLKDQTSRVVHYLAYSGVKFAQETQGGFYIQLSTAELAGKVGLAQDNVSVVVNKLITTKLISLVEGGLLIPDIKKLREFLEFLEMKEKFGNI